MAIPDTKAARHRRIVDVLDADGLAVTQATLSRDLDELGAVKLRSEDGHLVYALPREGGDSTPRALPGDGAEHRLGRLAEELVVSVEHSANIVVLRTPPGAAQFLASALDQTSLAEVIGTVAGDDTVLLVTRDPDGGASTARRLLDLAENARTP